MNWMPRFLTRFALRGASSRASPIAVWEVLAEELCVEANGSDPEFQRALDEYRKQRGVQTEDARANAEMAFRKLLIQRLHISGRTALCFSGGGIRSATFGLGVLQGLAAHSCGARDDCAPELLGRIDYLSTVSGGG